MPSRRAIAGVAKRVIFSYVFDWIILLAFGLTAAALNSVTPQKRPFSLGDADISFPFKTVETVSSTVAIAVALGMPAAVIVFVALVFVPGPTVPKSIPKSLVWRRKLWEWHTGWLGLSLSAAVTFLVTQGMKNLFGRPRPDLLSRCNPDMSKIAEFAATGFPITPANSVLVTAGICRQTDMALLNDGFRSFPSGHSSFSAAGLIYLSLFLCSKLAITIPFLSPAPYNADDLSRSAFPSRMERRALGHHSADSAAPSKQTDPYLLPTGANDKLISARHQAAAPPLYLLIFGLSPAATAIFIASSRFFDYRHHAFDIIFGFLIGFTTSVFSFRYYHLPISQGAGWSWGPRSKMRAFWAGIGVGGYVAGLDDVPIPLPNRTPDVEQAAPETYEMQNDNSQRQEGNGL